jgi:hypothetical protein
MPLIDAQNRFMNAQAVTATAIGADVINNLPGQKFNNTVRDIGAGEQLFLAIDVKEAATAAGAATVTFSLESDSTINLATAPTIHATTGAIAKTALTLNAQIFLPVPPAAYGQFVGVRATVATGPLTAGRFTAYLTTQPSTTRFGAKNYEV